jgi:hypothetical protein
MFHWVCPYTMVNPVSGKLFESRAELELLLNLNVWDYVKPKFEKITKRSERSHQKG